MCDETVVNEVIRSASDCINELLKIVSMERMKLENLVWQRKEDIHQDDFPF